MVKERMSLMEVVSALEKQQIVLPLFQRPFIWSEEQVCDLFDSLWQGYPIGEILLLEQIPPDLKQRLQCSPFSSQAGSQFLKEIVQQRRSEARIFEEVKQASHLVLDGQQRLFAFYIGVTGRYLRPAMPSSYESAKLYFDLYPLVKLFFESDGDIDNLRTAHHQFRFYSEAQLVRYSQDIQQEFLVDQVKNLDLASFPLLSLDLLQNWGRDRRTAKSEIRRFLKPLSSLPKILVDEFEDMLDNLHNYLWVDKAIKNTTVSPASSYDLLEIFSRLNQGASFQASDLHYAVTIIFPENSSRAGHSNHYFSYYLEKQQESDTLPESAANLENLSDSSLHNFLETSSELAAKPLLKHQHLTTEELAEFSAQEWRSEIFHELNPEKNNQAAMKGTAGGDFEENYERLLEAADDLKISLDFLYHCYLFCEAEEPEKISENIRKREGALALRNNGNHLLHFAEVLDDLRDAVDSCNFIVRHWFSDSLRTEYVLLPVIYYLYKQLNQYLDPLNDLENVDLSRIVRWIALNEVAPSIFRGGMQQLAALWPLLHRCMQNAMNRAKDEPESKNYFPLQQLQQDLQLGFQPESSRSVANGKVNEAIKEELRSLALHDKDIDQLLDHTKIKHRACVPLMALLYSHPQRISLMQRYEERQIDFIQPHKLLSKRMLKTYGLTEAQVELFFSFRESILNLQWVPKRLQTEKGDIPFQQWLSNSQQLQLLGEQNQFQKKQLLINFMRFHHIKTEDGIYTLNAFERFLAERKQLLRKSLKRYSQDFGDWDLQLKLTKIAYAAF